MRTYGRIRNPDYDPFTRGDGIGTEFAIGDSAIGGTIAPEFIWVEVDTDANGYNDAVMITTLIQTLKLNLGESPFFANYGIPARNAVQQQLPPDFYAARTQQQYAQYFASLIITRDLSATESPTYIVNLTTQQGSKIPAFGVAT